jgi:hypothetical protein
LTPSKAASFQAASLEPLVASAGTRIVSAEPFLKQLVAMYNSDAAFDVRFRRETSSTFTHGFEKKTRHMFGRA